MKTSRATYPATLDPVHLWQQFLTGDADAFGQLSELYYPTLYNYGMRFTGDAETVRDCLQDLLFELWNRRAMLSPTDNVKAYLLKAVRHKLIKAATRQKKWRTLDEVPFLDRETELPVESRIIETEQQAAQIERLNVLMQQLTKREKEIIYLRFYQALDHEAIAQVMSLTRPSVATLLHRALKALRDSWFDSILPMLLLLVAAHDSHRPL